MMAKSTLHYLTKGNRKNPPLLFLHGFLGCGGDWLEVTDHFAGRYFCILPDLPGHGRSTVGDDPQEYGFSATAEKIVAVVNCLEVGKVNLIGYSMGGRVALHLVLDYPYLFSTLVLEGINPGIRNEAERQQRLAWEDQIVQEIRQSELTAFIDHWYSLPLFRSLHNDPSRFEPLRQKRCLNNPAGLALSMAGIGLGKQANLWPRLAEIEIPTLLLSGSLDEKYQTVVMQMAGEMPNAKVEIISNAGHNTHYEKMDDYCRVVTEFLRDFVTAV